MQTFTLDAWCDLYDFTLGHWHSMLRKQIESAIAHYEWSTENANLTYSETLAHGEIAFTLNPEIGDTLTIGTAVLEFGVTDGIMIGDSLAETLTNLLSFLNTSTDPEVLKCTYTVSSGTELGIIFRTSGSLGNVFPIDVIVAGAVASDETLTGGGGMLVMIAPVEDLQIFVGDYYYDVRWQADDGTLVPLVGGIITFELGVTRDTQEPEET